jgi:hypothetical protein
VRAAELACRRTPQPTRAGNTLDSIRGLFAQRLWFDAAWFSCVCVVVSKLGETAIGA